MMTNWRHIDLLASYGAPDLEIEELLAYNRNALDRQGADTPPVLPLPAEPHVAAWERYSLEAAEAGAVAALRRRLVQLRFPIREGISQSEAYRAARQQPRDQHNTCSCRCSHLLSSSYYLGVSVENATASRSKERSRSTWL
jgi:hypothetical protein